MEVFINFSKVNHVLWPNTIFDIFGARGPAWNQMTSPQMVRESREIGAPPAGALWQCTAFWWRTRSARDRRISLQCFWCCLQSRSRVVPQQKRKVVGAATSQVTCAHPPITSSHQPEFFPPFLSPPPPPPIAAASRNTSSSVWRAETWDAARHRDSRLEAKLWHRHHRREGSCSKVFCQKVPHGCRARHSGTHNSGASERKDPRHIPLRRNNSRIQVKNDLHLSPLPRPPASPQS